MCIQVAMDGTIVGNREFMNVDFGENGDPKRPVNERGQGHLVYLDTVY